MKCIAYVSQVVARQNGAIIPTGLFEIIRVARKRNSSFNITGVMSYRRGRYIQVLEGDDAAVDQLFSNIASDPRHEDVTILFDFPISTRSFPQWEMRLMTSVDKDAEFSEFMNTSSTAVSLLDPNQQQLLSFFWRGGNKPSSYTQGYDNKDLMLRSWPDFTAIEPTPTIVELCARLTKAPYPYRLLLENKEFGTQQQLDRILDKFESLGILKVSSSTDATDLIASSKKAGGFYSKMKTFLSRR